MKIFKRKKIGSMLFVTLIATSIFIMLISGAISLGLLQGKFNKIKVAKSQALHISEAGINYYKWVLYHDPSHYCDETPSPCPMQLEYGPYRHAYSDQSGQIIGHYDLYITPSSADGSNIVTIKSVGWVDAYPNAKRTIEVKLGATSYASYLLLSNSSIRIGETTSTTGKIHSNSGVRFDGIKANGQVSSAVLNYDDPSHAGENEYGVHTHRTTVDPLPSSGFPLPVRSDIFTSGRYLGKPAVSFSLLDGYVADMYTLASNGGLVLPYSGKSGYYIEFMPSANPKMKIKRVTSITSPCGSIPTYGMVGTEKIPGGPTNSQYDVPSNGIIFIKDNVWVDASPHTGATTQATILAFKEPFSSGDANIIITNGTAYKNINSSSVLGFIAQHDILLGYQSPNNIEIDAAMIAKTGRIGREDYPVGCTERQKGTLDIYGSMVTATTTVPGYGFSYYDSSGIFTSGYQTINLNYDGNLRLNPPPHFPTIGEYQFMSWKED